MAAYGGGIPLGNLWGIAAYGEITREGEVVAIWSLDAQTAPLIPEAFRASRGKELL